MPADRIGPSRGAIASFPLYWHTLRHLRPVQVYGRAWFKFYRPLPNLTPAPALRPLSGAWRRPASKQVCMLGPLTFRFLNHERELRNARDWDDSCVDKLWRYNLHYFDDLNSENAPAHVSWHRDLMEHWVEENPPGCGTGWEPFPTSLRIVNWIKWSLAGHELSDSCRQSLAVQSRWLRKRLETHLLGNHLFSNAKALVFAGLFFDSSEALSWIEKGMRLLNQEIKEQILSDGGQFERSTMYHALALEDMLDLYNVTVAYRSAIPVHWASEVASWPEVVQKMRYWLAVMSHPDGEISFFNDAALEIAPSPKELDHYACRLGFAKTPTPGEGVTILPESGYFRIQRGPMISLVDVAPVGPSYLPGHAHADTLSFELSLFGQRIVVNSGTSCYGIGPDRQRQRGTAAHNTIVIDHQDSSEVWSSFRVAKRANASLLGVDEGNSSTKVTGCHDGYARLPGKNVHKRSWTAHDQHLLVEDEISGSFGEAEAHVHFHPLVEIERQSADSDSYRLRLPGGQNACVSVEGGISEVRQSVWHPAFGRTEPSSCLCIRLQGRSLRTTFEWSNGR